MRDVIDDVKHNSRLIDQEEWAFATYPEERVPAFSTASLSNVEYIRGLSHYIWFYSLLQFPDAHREHQTRKDVIVGSLETDPNFGLDKQMLIPSYVFEGTKIVTATRIN